MMLLRRVRAALFPPDTRKVYISGTGRAGTTFLVQLLAATGLDTGPFTAPAEGYFESARAGLERDVFAADGPTIIKSPLLCDHLDEVLAAGIAIRHVIVPVRDFHSAAASRLHVQQSTTGSVDGKPVAGGLWGTECPNNQAAILEHKFAALMEALVRNDIPFTLLSYPRIVRDPTYLYGKLARVFPISRRRFMVAFSETARPDLVHTFPALGGSVGSKVAP